MISFVRIIVFLAIFAVTFALGELHVTNNVDSTVENSKINSRKIVHEINLNKAFDAALPNLRNYITKNGFDPMDIPDIEVPLGPLPGLLNAKLHLHHGYMQELSTIYRNGDIILQYTDEKISLLLNIGFKTLDLSHQYNLIYLLYNRKGDCYGRYHDVKAKMLVDVDLKTHKIDLKFFKFISVGEFKLKLEGHLSDGLINIITTAITKLFRTEVLRLIEHKTYEEIDKKIKEINELLPDPKDINIMVKEIIRGHEYDDIAPYKMDGLVQM